MINKGQAAWFGLAWLPVVCEKVFLFTSTTKFLAFTLLWGSGLTYKYVVYIHIYAGGYFSILRTGPTVVIAHKFCTS